MNLASGIRGFTQGLQLARSSFCTGSKLGDGLGFRAPMKPFPPLGPFLVRSNDQTNLRILEVTNRSFAVILNFIFIFFTFHSSVFCKEFLYAVFFYIRTFL